MSFEKENWMENTQFLKDHPSDVSSVWIPNFQDDSQPYEEEFQSVPNLAFLDQSNYPTIGSTWFNPSTTNACSVRDENTSALLEELKILSPAPSSTSSFVFSDEEFLEVQRDGKFEKIVSRLGITEKTLQDFSVKDLNRFLKSNGLSKEEQNCIKSRRRTLKNRGYAQNCRIKRINVKKSLEVENDDLRKEVDQLKAEVDKAKRERNLYKQKLEKLAVYIQLHKR